MYRPGFAALSHHHHPRQWQENWARLFASFTIWLCVAISLRYGYYGDCSMLLGPSSSRLLKASSVFVKQVEVRNDDRKGVVLYGFTEKPELSLEENWSMTDYVIIGSYSRKGFSLSLNKGSRIQIGVKAETSSLKQLGVSVIKGERNYEAVSPTNSPGADIFDNSVEGREAEYVIEEDDTYFVGILNLNHRSVMAMMNVNISSKLYDTTKAKSMCSTRSGSCHLKLLFPNTQYVLVTTPNNGDLGGWYVDISFVARVIAYIGILGILVLVILLIFKYLGACTDESHEVEQPATTETSETQPLLPEKVFRLPYGTDEEDQEYGTGSSSEDLYNGNICVICYDLQRNCFFVPCGHCATCHDCAMRIMDGESRLCPICRRLINKVRKLIIP